MSNRLLVVEELVAANRAFEEMRDRLTRARVTLQSVARMAHAEADDARDAGSETYKLDAVARGFDVLEGQIEDLRMLAYDEKIDTALVDAIRAAAVLSVSDQAVITVVMRIPAANVRAKIESLLEDARADGDTPGSVEAEEASLLDEFRRELADHATAMWGEYVGATVESRVERA